MTWSERVKSLIRKAGTPERLATKIGVSYLTIMRWAKGTHVPSSLARKIIEGMEGGKRK